MANDERILVNLVSEDLSRRVKAQISSFINIKVIVALIVRRLGFPITVEDGKPLYYFVVHRESERCLRYYESLPMADVKHGDTLIICSVLKEGTEATPELMDVSVMQSIDKGEDLIVFDESNEFTTPTADGVVLVSDSSDEEAPLQWVGVKETPWRRAGPFRSLLR